MSERDAIQDRYAQRLDEGENEKPNPSQTTDRETPLEQADSSTSSSQETERSPQQYPLVMRRSRVKEGREQVIQIPALDDTHDHDRDGLHELAGRFDGTVPKLDRREAIYRAGLANLDDAEDVLRGWGHGIGE